MGHLDNKLHVSCLTYNCSPGHASGFNGSGSLQTESKYNLAICCLPFALMFSGTKERRKPMEKSFMSSSKKFIFSVLDLQVS